MNKKLMLLIISLIFISTPALAEKPDWAGKGKPSVDQKKAHKSAMETKGDLNDDLEEKGEKIKTEKEKKNMKQSDELKGLEKQKVKKSEQMQKEIDKGSEKGKEARKKRKKWWKFWDE